MKMKTVFFMAFAFACAAGRTAEVIPITSEQYDLILENFIWKAEGFVAPPPGGGQMGLSIGSASSIASFDFHETEDPNHVTLSYDSLTHLLTYSVSGHFGDEFVDLETGQGTDLAIGLFAEKSTDLGAAIRLARLSVNGVSYEGPWSAASDSPRTSFMLRASSGIEQVTFDVSWFGNQPAALSFQVLGFQAVPEPSILALGAIGLGALILFRSSLFLRRRGKEEDPRAKSR